MLLQKQNISEVIDLDVSLAGPIKNFLLEKCIVVLNEGHYLATTGELYQELLEVICSTSCLGT